MTLSSWEVILTPVSLIPCSRRVGGTAGSVVANRLTENPKFSVLVVEAGPTNEGVVDSQAPFLVGEMMRQPIWSWNYTTTPQNGLNGRASPYARAHILGGCSSHNGMFYTRGSRDDFDRYAALTDDVGWSWNRLLPYFFKNELWSPPADGHDTRGQFDPRVHGTHGLMSVSLAGFSYPASERIIQTTAERPDAFPFNLDMNSGNPLGVGWLQETIGGGERSSAATAYLSPRFQQRPNLHILLNSRVLRLLDDTSTAGVAFHGVEFSLDPSAPPSTVTARKEIILSAGAIGTPSILQHSGVGSATILRGLGLPTLLDLPSVGGNASDHPVLSATWAVSDNETTESVQQNATRFAEAFAEWNATKTGPSRRPAQRTSGPTSPHIELMFYTQAGSFGGLMPGGHFFSIGVAAVSPASRGSVTINSTDPLAAPLIDPGLLLNALDVVTLREGIKLAREFVTAPAWTDTFLTPSARSRTQLGRGLGGSRARDGGIGITHCRHCGDVCTQCGVWVVNPDLRVKGAIGLRIIDASVLRLSPVRTRRRRHM
ncbi:aryl-alcohol-oxidase from pleurotus Eryingii [Mycena leptocephala]|nr:aryl-alcohol-oxidase from pleurotus Eryingii [Mycena leptocephala]